MATQTSSLIGASLTGANSDATALFALGSVAEGTNGTRWEYVQATATFVTGEFVLLNAFGTAKTLLTALLTFSTPEGIDMAVCQGLINQGEHGWVAKQGRGLYVLCTGTLAVGALIGFGANSGRLIGQAGAAVGNTMLGVYLVSAAPDPSGQVVTLATITWPRVIGAQ